MSGADHRACAAAQFRAGWVAFGSCLALAIAAPAFAQQAEGGPAGVADRARPEYDPIGEKLGALLIHPQLKASAEHTDNVFATENNKQADTFVQVSPQITVETDWPRHMLSASAQGQFARYDKFKSEDSDAWSVSGAGRLDVTRDFNLKFNASHNDQVEGRTTAVYVLTPLEPVTFTRDTASVGFSKTFNRLRAIGTVSIASYDYDDTRDVIGDIIDQSYRNRDETQAKLRLAYAVSPKSSFFVEGGVIKHSYDTAATIGGSRDSKGYSMLVGVEGELTRLVHGEASVGLAHYDFANPAFSDVDNFNYNLQLEWYPTELLTISLTGAQALYDTPLPITPGYIYQSLKVNADYELRRNLIVSGSLQAAKEDYQGVSRTDKRYGGSVAARYLLARGVGVSVRYDHEQRDTSGVIAAGFRDNTVGLSVSLER
jgi:hypothetical protein